MQYGQTHSLSYGTLSHSHSHRHRDGARAVTPKKAPWVSSGRVLCVTLIAALLASGVLYLAALLMVQVDAPGTGEQATCAPELDGEAGESVSFSVSVDPSPGIITRADPDPISPSDVPDPYLIFGRVMYGTVGVSAGHTVTILNLNNAGSVTTTTVAGGYYQRDISDLSTTNPYGHGDTIQVSVSTPLPGVATGSVDLVVAGASTEIDVQVNAPPIIEVLSPNGGEFLSGTQSVEWTSIDTSGDVVTYDVYLSTDGGATYGSSIHQETHTATGSTNTYAWPWFDTAAHTLADGSSMLLKVEGTDGLGAVGADTSDAVFTIDNTAPLASIVIQSGAAWTNSYTVDLDMTYSDALAGVEEVRYRDDGYSWGGWKWCLPHGCGPPPP